MIIYMTKVYHQIFNLLYANQSASMATMLDKRRLRLEMELALTTLYSGQR